MIGIDGGIIANFCGNANDAPREISRNIGIKRLRLENIGLSAEDPLELVSFHVNNSELSEHLSFEVNENEVLSVAENGEKVELLNGTQVGRQVVVLEVLRHPRELLPLSVPPVKRPS